MVLLGLEWFVKGVLLFGLAERECGLIKSSFQIVLVA